MKFLIVLVVLTQFAFAQSTPRMSQQGVRFSCVDARDVDNTGYTYSNPALALTDEKLSIAVKGSYVKCVEVDGVVKPVVTAADESYALIVSTFNTFRGAEIVGLQTEIDITLRHALKKRELNKFRSGKVARGSVYLYNRYKAGEYYRASSGYYKLSYELSKGSAKITGFDSF